jgi:hypothetical protein
MLPAGAATSHLGGALIVAASLEERWNIAGYLEHSLQKVAILLLNTMKAAGASRVYSLQERSENFSLLSRSERLSLFIPFPRLVYGGKGDWTVKMTAPLHLVDR